MTTAPAHLAYAREVLAGTIIAGRYMKLAAERSLRDHDSPPGPWRWMPQAVEGRYRFMESMPLTQGAQWTGRRLRLQPWQRWNVGEVWGWRHADEPHRLRFRQSVLEVAKGGGKTPIAGIESVYALLYGDPGTNVVSFATRQKQAALCFDAAVRMIESRAFPKSLRRRLEVTKSGIKSVSGGSTFEAMPSTDRSLDGYVISYLVFDEAASLLNRERTMDILSAARKLPGAHTRWITTAQTGAKDRLYWERRQHCIDVLEGRETDERIHAALYTVDVEDEKGTKWRDPRCWPKANPSLDVTQDRDMLTEALDEAMHSPSTRPQNLAKHLNIYSAAVTSWIDTAEWRACSQGDDIGAPTCPVEWLDTLARLGIEGKLSIGIDLAENRDLTAVSCALAGADGRTYLHFKAFAPRVALDRLPLEVQAHWHKAAADDVLMVHDGPITDYDAIEDYIRAIGTAAGDTLSSVALCLSTATD